MENQQLPSLTRKQLQLITSAKFGDGHLTKPTTEKGNSMYATNCIHREYLDYKKEILAELGGRIKYVEKNGYAQKPIYILTSKCHPVITVIRSESIQESLNRLDTLGVALWLYDDGSLHKHKHFYNINTHAYSKEIQENLFIPFFNSFDIYPKITKETKKDGRVFYYLRVSRFEGSFEISNILRNHFISCYSYKIWSSETMNLFSKLQVELKRKGAIISNKHMGLFMKRGLAGENVQDIVRSLEKSKAPKLRWVGVE